ncbi:MAG: cupin domain-containing protein [bacterium]
MLSKRNTAVSGIVICLFIFFATLAFTNAADTTSQIVAHVDQILKDNPLKAGETIQRIKVAEDDTITVFVVRLVEGAEIKAHFHKTHNETVYVIKGTGRMLVNDKWTDIKPGTVHFNPMGKVHQTKNTGDEPLVGISIFTPAMREPDSHFVESH